MGFPLRSGSGRRTRRVRLRSSYLVRGRSVKMGGNHDGDQPMTPGERWTVFFFTTLLIVLFAAETFTNYQPVKLGGLLFVVFWMPLMVLHEFGHAAVAWLLGWRVRQVVLGMGKLLGSFSIGRTPVEVRLILTTGFVV